MTPHRHTVVISVAIILAIGLHFGMSYSFLNCIESQASNHTIFKCYKRQVQTFGAIVDDLPQTTKNLTISYCKLVKIPALSFKNLTRLKTLIINDNHVRDIDEDAFFNLTHLRNLNLSGNQISHLHPRVFTGLHNLTTLLLADNRLTTLSRGLFSNLTNLKTLVLRRNQLTCFSLVVDNITNLHALTKLDLSFNSLTSLSHSSNLPQALSSLYLSNNNLSALNCTKNFLSSVKVLDLSYNNALSNSDFYGRNLSGLRYLRLRSTNVSITDLLKSGQTEVKPWYIDFSGLGLTEPHLLCNQLIWHGKKSIQNLVLQSNGINALYNDTLSQCPFITKLLDLSGNHLKSTRCLQFLRSQKKTSILKMEHNHITKLINCSAQGYARFPNLEDLSYRYNRILQVNAFAFSVAPNLKTLWLNINIIAYMDHKALNGLHKLETLRLDNNLLTDLYNDSFKDLHSLKTLNLRNNQIAVIFNKTFQYLRNLTILDLGGNKITQLRPEAFDGLDNLANLYLDRNRLQDIDSQQIGKLHATLQVLDLQGNHIHYYTEHVYSPFENLTKLLDLKLDSQYPYGITLLPHAFFRGLTSLKSLYLTNNHISYFSADTFDDLRNLTFLTLDDSCVGVTQLKTGIFKNLRKLETLQMENMGIQSFSKEVFGNLTALKRLHLNRNAIQTLDINLLENLTNLQYLDIRNSPLSCDCPNNELQNWTLSNKRVQFIYLYNLACPNQNGTNFYNFDTYVCYTPDLEKYLFGSTYFVTLLLMLLPLLYVKLYWKCKYGWYVFRSWFGEQWRRLREEEEKCLYDAFISYNSADEKWVMEKLLPNIEGNKSLLRLCLHHRDFEPGRNIVDNIVSAVYSSRKTVCLVSQNYLRSEWCSLEIQLASYRLFDEMRDVLLLVFLESIPQRQLSTYHRMRKVMLKKTYLQWPGPDCTDPKKAEALFWKQLKKAIRSSNSIHEENEQMDVDVQKDAVGMGKGWSANEPLVEDEPYYLMP